MLSEVSGSSLVRLDAVQAKDLGGRVRHPDPNSQHRQCLETIALDRARVTGVRFTPLRRELSPRTVNCEIDRVDKSDATNAVNTMSATAPRCP